MMPSSENKPSLSRRQVLQSGWGGFVFTLVVLFLFKLFPGLADAIYRGIIFPFIRMAWDYTIGLLPFPIIYLVLIGAPLSLFYHIKKARKNGYSVLWMASGKLAGWAASFFWLWGFNYWCSDLQSDELRGLSDQQLYELGVSASRSAAQERSDIAHPFAERKDAIDLVNWEVKEILQQKKWKTYGNPGYHTLNDNGFIRRIGISGIYFPYAGEGYSSNTFNPLSSYFIAAHELAHAYGVSHEGEADYVAWSALRNDSIPEFRYSAHVYLLKSVRSLLRASNDSLWMKLVQQTDAKVNRDIALMRLEWELYPEFNPGLGEKVNDHYLQLMGNPQGVRTYDQFVELVWNDSTR